MVYGGSIATNAIGGISETLTDKGFATILPEEVIRKTLRIQDLGFFKEYS